MIVVRDALVMASPFEAPFHGWVAIEGNRIREVGRGVAPDFPQSEVLEARGGALIPGFANTHAHSHSSLTRGSAEGMALEAWIASIIREQKRLTPEQAYVGALATYAEALLSGTTAILDMCLIPEAAMQAAETLGIRALVAPYVADSMSFAPTLRHTEELIERGGARVRACVGLHDLETCSDAQIEAGVDLAAKHGALLHLHCAESKFSTEKTRKRTGRSPVAHLDALGAFSVRAHLAHCVWVSDEDQQVMKSHGVSVAHCPHANLKLGSGIAPVPAMRRAGVRVALATDGAKANNRLDLFDVMKFASLLHKGAAHDPAVLPAEEILDMAGAQGMAALGIEAGRIAPGQLADLCVVSPARLHLQPMHSETLRTNLVHAARGSDIDTVIVDGRVVVRRGKLATFDEAELVARLAETGRSLLA